MRDEEVKLIVINHLYEEFDREKRREKMIARGSSMVNQKFGWILPTPRHGVPKQENKPGKREILKVQKKAKG